MNYLNIMFCSFLFLVLSQIIHILIWRNNRLPSPRLILIAIFIIVPPILVLFLYYTASIWKLQYLLRFTLSEGLAAYLLHGAIGAGYFFLYPTAQDGSPAVRLSLYLHAHMPEGVTRDELKTFLLSKDDLGPRVNDLLVSGYIEKSEDGRLNLTHLGKIFIWPFMLVRRFFGLRLGED